MSRFGLARLVLVLALTPSTAPATPDARAEAEIRALLSFVEHSGCRFIRSGEAHDGAAARQHLERKYEYARRLLTTADQFVDRVASGSSMTGEDYRVRCDGREQSARDWLRAELARVRAGGALPPRSQ